MMDDLDVLANAPRKFVVGGKAVAVRRMSMFDLARARSDIIDDLKAQRRAELVELAKSLPEKERARFLVEAIKCGGPTEEEVGASMSSGKGLASVLSVALGIALQEVGKLLADPAEHPVLQQVFEFVLDVATGKDAAEAPQPPNP